MCISYQSTRKINLEEAYFVNELSLRYFTTDIDILYNTFPKYMKLIQTYSHCYGKSLFFISFKKKCNTE